MPPCIQSSSQEQIFPDLINHEVLSQFMANPLRINTITQQLTQQIITKFSKHTTYAYSKLGATVPVQAITIILKQLQQQISNKQQCAQNDQLVKHSKILIMFNILRAIIVGTFGSKQYELLMELQSKNNKMIELLYSLHQQYLQNIVNYSLQSTIQNQQVSMGFGVAVTELMLWKFVSSDNNRSYKKLMSLTPVILSFISQAINKISLKLSSLLHDQKIVNLILYRQVIATEQQSTLLQAQNGSQKSKVPVQNQYQQPMLNITVPSENIKVQPQNQQKLLQKYNFSKKKVQWADMLQSNNIHTQNKQDTQPKIASTTKFETNISSFSTSQILDILIDGDNKYNLSEIQKYTILYERVIKLYTWIAQKCKHYRYSACEQRRNIVYSLSEITNSILPNLLSMSNHISENIDGKDSSLTHYLSQTGKKPKKSVHKWQPIKLDLINSINRLSKTLIYHIDMETHSQQVRQKYSELRKQYFQHQQINGASHDHKMDIQYLGIQMGQLQQIPQIGLTKRELTPRMYAEQAQTKLSLLRRKKNKLRKKIESDIRNSNINVLQQGRVRENVRDSKISKIRKKQIFVMQKQTEQAKKYQSTQKKIKKMDKGKPDRKVSRKGNNGMEKLASKQGKKKGKGKTRKLPQL